jgi:hypothetical protein
MKRTSILAAVLVCLAAGTAVNADVWNKKTKVTFSGPVQVPAPSSSAGVLTLPAGTYVFKLADSSSSRSTVQVTNERGDKLYTTILAIPDYRLNASSKTVMYFSERKAGSPVPLKSWFYPGDNFGQRFVYPKVQAAQIAAEVNQPVPSHTVETVEKVKIVEVPVYIETPARQEVPYQSEQFAKHDTTDTQGEDGEAVTESVPPAASASMPKTASPMYLIGIMGLVLLGISLLARRAMTQMR